MAGEADSRGMAISQVRAAREALQHSRDRRVGRDAGGDAVVAEDQAMAQHVGRQVLDIVGRAYVRPRMNASARAPRPG